MIDLAEDQIAAIRRILAKFVPTSTVVAFGSRVTGTGRRFSDLDLVLIGPEPVASSVMADLKETFSNSDLPIRVDLLDWFALSDSFRDVIARSPHVVLREPDKILTGVNSV